MIAVPLHRSADIPVWRIAGFLACPRRAFLPAGSDWSNLADKNVGDTADRNICSTMDTHK
jgi:hypothetical protein